MNDPGYKRLFSRPPMIRDLLSGFAARAWSETLDFASLSALPASYVTTKLQQRHSDLLWRIRFRDTRWLYVVVLLEFQSTVDQRMAVRMLTYTGLLYERLIADGALRDHDKLPPVLPIVIYNGAQRWSAPTGLDELIATGPSDALTAYQPSLRYFLLDHGRVQNAGLPPDNLVSALVALEASTTPAETEAVTDRLIDLLVRHDDQALTEAFSTWVQVLLLPRERVDTTTDPLTRLKEVRTMLAERVQEWTREWQEHGRAEGRAEGYAAERSLLLRQTARKFKTTAADQLATAIADLRDPERLAEIGESIIDCSTATELLERVRTICRRQAPEQQD